MASFAQFGNELYTGARSYNIVGRRKLWFTIAITGMLLSFLVLGTKGINPGIEFRGGPNSRLPTSPRTPVILPAPCWPRRESRRPRASPRWAPIRSESVPTVVMRAASVTPASASTARAGSPEFEVTLVSVNSDPPPELDPGVDALGAEHQEREQHSGDRDREPELAPPDDVVGTRTRVQLIAELGETGHQS